MIISITDYLDRYSKENPDKCIFADLNYSISYIDFVKKARSVASYLPERKNVAIFIDKTVNCLTAMFAAAYANACYTIIDVESPIERIRTILSSFQPDCILTDAKNESTALNGGYGFTNILVLEKLYECDEDKKKLDRIRERRIDTDPLYVLFTSGSTGVPKGTVVAHRSVIDYATVICETFDVSQDTVWGSQTPFYFSMSILDVFSTVVAGATLQIIPKMYFSFPMLLIDYLNQKMINSIYWVPTALSIVADYDTLSKKRPEFLKTVLFAGEVMPVKQLNYWIRCLPDVLYANLYGPTEITDTCTYYVVNRAFKDSDSLPIGRSFNNCEVIIINEENKQVLQPEDGMGELFVRGSFLGLGYYNEPEKTRSAFIQNPLNTAYPELLYRTGDIVCFNEYGELIFKGRRDSQIKHMGHRIELGEVEAVASGIENVERTCCIYDNEKLQIVLFYTGKQTEEQVSALMHSGVPKYMVPQRVIHLPAFPINMNGKIDRIKLKEEL